MLPRALIQFLHSYECHARVTTLLCPATLNFVNHINVSHLYKTYTNSKTLYVPRMAWSLSSSTSSFSLISSVNGVATASVRDTSSKPDTSSPCWHRNTFLILHSVRCMIKLQWWRLYVEKADLHLMIILISKSMIENANNMLILQTLDIQLCVSGQWRK
jgi:hypothetical protein